LKRSYDTIAFIYDRLARLVFGSTLIRAQQYLLVNTISPGGSILIVGGGTGWILEEITFIQASGLNITYVDASAKMVALAKKRNTGANKVTFIALPIQQVVIDDVYDIVLTPFFFDNFTNEDAQEIFSSIDRSMNRGGVWLYCDFNKTTVFWQKTVLKIMYFFFRISCGIKTDKLPDMGSCFAKHGYQLKNQKTFLNGFINAAVYTR